MPFMRAENKTWLAEHVDFTGEPNSIGWRCKETKELILAEKTGRTIWDDNGPGPCASSQGVQMVVETYCPACGTKPNISHGSPIQEGDLISI
jgi:hypothetical protein